MAAGGGGDATTQQILRITDIAQESLEFLAPISGYEKMPIVSLEEAVKDLVPILPTIQSHAYVAKQRCKNPADGLTQDESASIMLYTMGWEPLDECLYLVLNNTLRSLDRQEKLKPWFLYLRLFLNALFRLPSLQQVAYRGVKLDMSKRYLKGETVVWWGFSSCTTTVEVLKSNLFLGKTGTRTIFNLQCESAKDISKHSYYRTENEVLLLPATQFQVISSLDQGDLHIIQLKETHPPYPLLQPIPVIVPQPSHFSTPVLTSSPKTKPTLSTKIVTALVPQQLTTVKLVKPQYRNPELKKLIVKENASLELSLGFKNLTDQDMEIVAYYALYNNKALTTLNLSFNEIGTKGAQYLSDALRQNMTLTTLNLGYNHIGAQGTQHLSNALRENRTLTALHLGRNQLGAQGTQYLSDALQKNTTLTALNLEDNQIRDEGAQHLSNALRENTILILLDLQLNGIGPVGVEHLSNALQKNTTLNTLNLSYNQIEDKGAAYLFELQKIKTDLTVVW